MKTPFGTRETLRLSTAAVTPVPALAGGANPAKAAVPAARVGLWTLRALAAVAVIVLGLAGCATKHHPASSEQHRAGQFSDVASPAISQTNSVPAESLVLREGDTVRIAFPGSPSLNTVQQIRRDGKLGLAMVGEVQAAGLTPVQLEKELVKLYGPQLVDKEVTVVLENSAFQVFVTGAVARPGKLISDRPLTALEALIDAGVDYQKANLKAVRLIRRENGRETVQILNLKKALEGNGGEPFYLKPSDIVFVRERFTWF